MNSALTKLDLQITTLIHLIVQSVHVLQDNQKIVVLVEQFFVVHV